MQLTELKFYINNIARCIGILKILYLKGYNIISATISSSVPLFSIQLYTNYQTFTKNILFYQFQRNIQPQHKLYYSLYIPILTQDTATLRTYLYILNPPPLLTHLHHLCQNINLTAQFKPWFINILINLRKWSSWEKNNLKNQRKLEMNWLISTKNKKHWDSNNIPKWQKKEIHFS